MKMSGTTWLQRILGAISVPGHCILMEQRTMAGPTPRDLYHMLYRAKKLPSGTLKPATIPLMVISESVEYGLGPYLLMMFGAYITMEKSRH